MTSCSSSSKSSQDTSTFDLQPCVSDGKSVLERTQAPSQSLDDFDATFFTLGGDECDPILSRCEAPFSVFAKTILEGSCDVIGGAVRMLNDICHIYEEHNNIPPERRMEFVDHSHAALLHHPRKSTSARPEIIAVPAFVARSWHRKSSTSIAWHHVAAAVHVSLELETDPLLKDCECSLGALNHARPDLPGCFAMAMYRSGFQVLWADPSTLSTSEHTDWSDPGMVVYALGFLHFLYSPFARDRSICLEMSLPSAGADDLHNRRPVWLLQDDKGGTYRSRTVLSVGEPGPQSHYNWVASASEYRATSMSTFLPCARTIIKDSWLSPEDEPTSEPAILRHIHADGGFPGVCNVRSAFRISVDVRASNGAVLSRNKHRLILDGTGQDLYSCTSVVEFLMVMYDVLEVLKRVHETYGVLHRDISIGNILRRSAVGCSSACSTTKFAGDILSCKYPQVIAGPRCTLIDFDHAFWKDHSSESSLRDTVGTRPFVSRAITRRFELPPTIVPPPIMPLTGSAHECYIRVCGEQAYDDTSASHSRVDLLIERDVRQDRAHFNPHHDAESCYWVILHFFLTALPVGIDSPAPATARLCRFFDMPEFGDIFDQRQPFFSLRRQTWPRALHSHLQDFGPFLCMLTHAISPVYEYCDPPPRQYHLHDTMQRIILQEICRVLDNGSDVQLNVNARRIRMISHIQAPPPLSAKPSPRQTNFTKKRSGATLHRSDTGHRRRLR